MMAAELVPGVHWVGAIDWNLREYHGYTLPGTTYNAYLVRGEKTALIDGAYHGFEGEVLGRIESVCNPGAIDYIVVNHIEMDHSGTLPAFVRRMPDVPIYCTGRAAAGLARHYDISGWKIHVVKSGDTLDLGGKTLTFLEAPMLHWPDSMFTYLVEDAILFPNDAFGQHVASAARFDDELGKDAAMAHAQKFFANLIIPLAPKVLKKLDEVGGLGIDIRMIAPSHGIVWRSYAGDILKAYTDWSRGVAKEKVTIVYDTMHGSTTMMARAIAEGIMAEGADVRVCLLRDGRYEGTHRSDIVTDILDSKAVIIGSPTLQDEVLPTVAGFLSYLRGLAPGRLTAKKIGCAFGSHGGMGGAVAQAEAALKAAGIEVIDGGFQVNYRPDGDELGRAYELGRRVVQEIRAR